MTSTLSLQAGSFGQVLGVLSTEHESCRTTASQRLTYRLLLGDVAVLLLSGVLFGVLEMADPTHRSAWWGISALIVVLAFVLLIPLFLLNLPTLVRLWRYARMIRRLRLPPEVQRLIRQHKRSQMLTAIVAYPAAILGFGLVALGVYGAIVEGHSVADYVYAVAFLLAGCALISVAYLRSGHRRLTAVSEFLRLERARMELRFDVDVEDWAAVVALERQQLQRTSVEKAVTARSEGAAAPAYHLLTSTSAHERKARLAAHERVAVQNQMLALMNNPYAARVRTPEGRRSVPVEGTNLEIRYDVDDARKAVQIYDVVGPGDLA